MKLPPFLKAAVDVVATTGKRAGDMASSAFSMARETADKLRSGINPRMAKIAALAVAGLVLVILAIVGIGLASASSNGRTQKKAVSEPPEATAAGVSGTARPSGTALASQLLIPGDGELPYPLALDPKPRYTQAEADAVRPDLGKVDVSGITGRRKAELEAIFGAVD